MSTWLTGTQCRLRHFAGVAIALVALFGALEGCNMQKQEPTPARQLVLDLDRPPTRSSVGMPDGEIAVVVDDSSGADIDVVLRTTNGEVRLDARSVVYESDRSNSEPARAVVKLAGVDLPSFAESVGRLGVLAADINIDEALTAFVEAQSSLEPGSDEVSNEVLTLIAIDGGRGIEVNLRFRPSSGLAVATIYIVWI